MSKRRRDVQVQLEIVRTERQAAEFLAFGREICASDPNCRDNDTGLASMLLYGRTAFAAHSRSLPLLVRNGSAVAARAMLLADRNVSGYCMLGLFAAVPGAAAAVQLILAQAREFAAAGGYSRVIVGINGHFSYGLGFLASHFDTVPCFGFPYNPSYYLDFFADGNVYEFSSFHIDVGAIDLTPERPILERVQRQGYTFRYADLRHLRREAAVYNAISNAAYPGHIFWAPRTEAEDYEQFHSLRGFLQDENLIVAEKEGEAVGYILWYPDINQLTGPAEGIRQGLYRATGGGRERMDRFRLAEICLRPEHQGSGAALGLIERLYTAVAGRYASGEAGWIFAENVKSNGLARRWQNRGLQEYKRYRVFAYNV